MWTLPSGLLKSPVLSSFWPKSRIVRLHIGHIPGKAKSVHSVGTWQALGGHSVDTRRTLGGYTRWALCEHSVGLAVCGPRFLHFADLAVFDSPCGSLWRSSLTCEYQYSSLSNEFRWRLSPRWWIELCHAKTGLKVHNVDCGKLSERFDRQTHGPIWVTSAPYCKPFLVWQQWSKDLLLHDPAHFNADCLPDMEFVLQMQDLNT